jgi:hypothetical protein
MAAEIHSLRVFPPALGTEHADTSADLFEVATAEYA